MECVQRYKCLYTKSSNHYCQLWSGSGFDSLSPPPSVIPSKHLRGDQPIFWIDSQQYQLKESKGYPLLHDASLIDWRYFRFRFGDIFWKICICFKISNTRIHKRNIPDFGLPEHLCSCIASPAFRGSAQVHTCQRSSTKGLNHCELVIVIHEYMRQCGSRLYWILGECSYQFNIPLKIQGLRYPYLLHRSLIPSFQDRLIYTWKPVFSSL